MSISGSAVGLGETVTVEARVRDVANFSSNTLSLDAQDNSTNVFVAGSGSVSIGLQNTVGVAGAVVVLIGDKTIQSTLEATSSAMRLSADSLSLKAQDLSGNYSFAAGVSVAKGTSGNGLSGSVIVVSSKTQIDAGIKGTVTNGITLGGSPNITVLAKNDAAYLQIAGAVAFGSSLGVDAAVVVTALESLVQTDLSYTISEQSADANKLDMQSVTDLRIDSLAFAGAGTTGSVKGAGVGMVAINHLKTSTLADVDNSSIKVSSGTDGILLSALNTSYLGAAAGGLAGSTGSAAVGVGVALSFAVKGKNRENETRGTEVRVQSTTLETAAAPMALLSTSDLTFVTVAIGAAGSSSRGAYAGSAAANVYRVNTRVSANSGSTLTTGGTVRFEAQDLSNLTSVAGGFGLVSARPVVVLLGLASESIWLILLSRLLLVGR